ncbi:MAG: hypothetical protein MZV64_23890 [Ignavibacteriales bacterium]|nr:hypothetical protein [Ignavibacteriales bacterium]
MPTCRRNYSTRRRLHGPEWRRHARRAHHPQRRRRRRLRGRRDRPADHPAPQRLARQPGQDGTVRRLHPAGHADQAGTRAQPDPHPAAQLGRQHPGRRDDATTSRPRRPGFAADGTPLADPDLHIQPADQGLQRHGLRRHDAGQPRVQLRQRMSSPAS